MKELQNLKFKEIFNRIDDDLKQRKDGTNYKDVAMRLVQHLFNSLIQTNLTQEDKKDFLKYLIHYLQYPRV